MREVREGTAWLLVERPPHWTTGKGKERIEGIALTNEDASEFVARNNEPGYARSSLPFTIISYQQSREG